MSPEVKLKRARAARIGYIMDNHCRGCIERCGGCPFRLELDGLVAQLEKNPRGKTKSHKDSDLRKYVIDSILAGKSKEKMAEELDYHPVHLDRRIRELFGKPFNKLKKIKKGVC